MPGLRKIQFRMVSVTRVLNTMNKLKLNSTCARESHRTHSATLYLTRKLPVNHIPTCLSSTSTPPMCFSNISLVAACICPICDVSFPTAVTIQALVLGSTSIKQCLNMLQLLYEQLIDMRVWANSNVKPMSNKESAKYPLAQITIRVYDLWNLSVQ